MNDLQIRRGPKGRGVYATRAFNAGEIIEICPVVICETDHIIGGLEDYSYDWNDKSGSTAAIALGYGSIYNHAYNANAHYERDFEKEELKILALINIQSEDEITINYNGIPGCLDPVWFDLI